MNDFFPAKSCHFRFLVGIYWSTCQHLVVFKSETATCLFSELHVCVLISGYWRTLNFFFIWRQVFNEATPSCHRNPFRRARGFQTCPGRRVCYQWIRYNSTRFPWASRTCSSFSPATLFRCSTVETVISGELQCKMWTPTQGWMKVNLDAQRRSELLISSNDQNLWAPGPRFFLTHTPHEMQTLGGFRISSFSDITMQVKDSFGLPKATKFMREDRWPRWPKWSTRWGWGTPDFLRVIQFGSGEKCLHGLSRLALRCCWFLWILVHVVYKLL